MTFGYPNQWPKGYLKKWETTITDDPVAYIQVNIEVGYSKNGLPGNHLCLIYSFIVFQMILR